MAEQFANKAETTLNGAIDADDLDIIVSSATGFPTIPTFRILIKAEGSNTDEICTVTSIVGTTYTVTRASEAIGGTQAASAHASGAEVIQVLTAGGINSANSATYAYGQDGSTITCTSSRTIYTLSTTLDPGVYLVIGKVNVAASVGVGAITFTTTGTLVFSSTSDPRATTYQPRIILGLISHTGGSLGITMYHTHESGTTTYGNAGEPRFAACIIASKIGL